MAISDSRLTELYELYDELKIKVIAIDEKYSPDYVEPKLDLPENLGLVKLTYVPKTEEEILALAMDKAHTDYMAKRRTLDKSLAEKLAVLNAKRDSLAEEYRLKAAKLLSEHNEAVDKTYRKLANNGLVFSTVHIKWNDQELKNYNKRVSELNTQNANEREIIDDRLLATEEAHDGALVALEKEKQAKITQYSREYREKDERERVRVFKYNSSVDEKETKYKASCEKAYEYARQAEYDRMYKVAKLYAEIGENGVTKRKLEEKFALCKQTFYALTKEEALALATCDSFLNTHLSTYYASLIDWIKATLK